MFSALLLHTNAHIKSRGKYANTKLMGELKNVWKMFVSFYEMYIEMATYLLSALKTISWRLLEQSALIKL